MKRIFCCLCCLILLTGCAVNAVQPDVKNLEFTAEFEIGGEKFRCSCKTDEKGGFKAKYLSPETVKGLEYIYSADDFSAKYMGLTYKAANKSAAYLGVTDRMNTVFSDAATKQAQKSGEEYVIKSKPLGEEYEIYFSASGLPLKLKLSDIEILILDVKQR